MPNNELFIKEFEKHLICVDYDKLDTGYATYTFEFKSVYRVNVLNREGSRKWELEISISNRDKERVPVYEVIQEETVTDIKKVSKILRNVQKASEHPNLFVYNFI